MKLLPTVIAFAATSALATNMNCFTKEAWTQEKKDWCCEHKKLGCPGPRQGFLGGIPLMPGLALPPPQEEPVQAYTPCACPMLRCEDNEEGVLVPGTLDNCCGGDITCEPKCAAPLVRCTSRLQASGLHCALSACVRVSAEAEAEEDGKLLLGGGTHDHVQHGRPLGGDDNDRVPHGRPRMGEGDHDRVPHGRFGAKHDEKGCVKGGGYHWCDALQKCHRPWEEECPAPAKVVLGASKDNGCMKGGGYHWCEALQKCHRPWEEKCEEAKPSEEEAVSLAQAQAQDVDAAVPMSSTAVGLVAAGLVVLAMGGGAATLAYRKRRLQEADKAEMGERMSAVMLHQ